MLLQIHFEAFACCGLLQGMLINGILLISKESKCRQAYVFLSRIDSKHHLIYIWGSTVSIEALIECEIQPKSRYYNRFCLITILLCWPSSH